MIPLQHYLRTYVTKTFTDEQVLRLLSSTYALSYTIVRGSYMANVTTNHSYRSSDKLFSLFLVLRDVTWVISKVL